MVYEIEYSKRRKTVGILVERDRRVVVKAPEGFPASRIQEIVEKKKDWIEEKVNDSYKYPTQPSKKEFVSGESMMLMGRNCTLLVIDENIRGIKGSHEKPCGLCVDFCQSEQEKLSIYDATQQSPELFHFCIKGFSRCICRPIDKVVKDFILSVIHSCRYIIEGFIPKFSYFAIP